MPVCNRGHVTETEPCKVVLGYASGTMFVRTLEEFGDVYGDGTTCRAETFPPYPGMCGRFVLRCCDRPVSSTEGA